MRIHTSTCTECDISLNCTVADYIEKGTLCNEDYYITKARSLTGFRKQFATNENIYRIKK